MEVSNHSKQVTFRIQGLSCTSCALQFEQNVQALPGVQEAKVNFANATITVTGEVDRQAIEQAGAFDNLKIYDLDEEPVRLPFWKNILLFRTLLSGLFLVTGWLVHFIYPEGTVTISLYLLAMLIGGYALFLQGLKNLVRLRFDMNTLMTLAVLGAAAIGEWGEGATVVFLFAISQALEKYAMDRARRSIRSLMELAPKQATILRNGQELVLPASEINIGDIMMVKPGEKLAMDGKVVKGSSTLNQAAITGESLPVNKTVGDEVYAGTLNGEGLLEVEVTKRVEDTAISKMIKLVEEAQSERAPAQAFIDRFAQYYTPVIILISVCIMLIPPLFLDGTWQDFLYRGLAVLVVGCPCALVISTPVAIVTAIGQAARHGVLIKGGVHLENLGKLSAVAFDKTGTLTEGLPTVTDFEVVDQKVAKEELFMIAAALERHSTHPLAAAILRFLEEAKVDIHRYQASQFTSLTGKGVKATVNGQVYYLGNPSLIRDVLTIQAPHEPLELKEIFSKVNQLQRQGKTVMLFSTEASILAIIAVRDQPRKESKQVLEKLAQLGMKKTVMLTGDNRYTAESIARELGIDEVRAELLPEEKLQALKELKAAYKEVAMVGDGVNDAPALAASTIGIAMGGAGSDTALETADIALMGDELEKLPFAIRLSRKTLNVIKQNVSFSIGIKLLALILILPGWLTLWLAIFADLGATLLVTLNGLRLLKVKE